MKQILHKAALMVSIPMVAFCAYVILFEYYPLRSAGRAYQTGQYEIAASQYQWALRLHPDSAMANFNLGAALYKQGNYDQAAACFTKAAASQDNILRQMAYYNLGNCGYRSGYLKEEQDREAAARLYKKSIGYYSQAMALNANDGDAQYNRVLVEKQLGALINRSWEEARNDPKKENRRDAETNRSPGSQGQGRQENVRQAGHENFERKLSTDVKRKSAEQGKGAGPIKYKQGQMSRQDAEMLLEEAAKREQAGSVLADKAKRMRDQEVEKNW